jgi:hypothetical protein
MPLLWLTRHTSRNPTPEAPLFAPSKISDADPREIVDRGGQTANFFQRSNSLSLPRLVVRQRPGSSPPGQTASWPAPVCHFQSKASGAQPAVTSAVAKRKGTNATDVAHHVAEKLDTLKGTLVPPDLHRTVTRDYGETAADKSNELLWHMLLAVLSVSALIWRWSSAGTRPPSC